MRKLKSQDARKLTIALLIECGPRPLQSILPVTLCVAVSFNLTQLNPEGLMSSEVYTQNEGFKKRCFSGEHDARVIDEKNHGDFKEVHFPYQNK